MCCLALFFPRAYWRAEEALYFTGGCGYFFDDVSAGVAAVGFGGAGGVVFGLWGAEEAAAVESVFEYYAGDAFDAAVCSAVYYGADDVA